MIKSCSLYIRKGEIIVVSQAMTTHGFETCDQPVLRLDTNESNITVGEAVMKALSLYRKNIPPHGPLGRKPDPILEFAGVRTWGQLERRSRCISISEESGSVTVGPTRRPPEGGYNHLDKLAIHCRAVPEEIGAAVRQAAALCE